MSRSELVDLQVEILHETELAILVRTDALENGGKVWLPKSAIEIYRGDPIPGACTITLPEKLAIEKELI